MLSDCDVFCAECPAGRCPVEAPAEKVNGALAKRQQGAMVIYDSLNPDIVDAARKALLVSISRIHGTTLEAAGASSSNSSEASAIAAVSNEGASRTN